MEVAYPLGLLANTDLSHQAAAMAIDEMEIDIDSDLGPIEEGETFQSVSVPFDTQLEWRVSLTISIGA